MTSNRNRAATGAALITITAVIGSSATAAKLTLGDLSMINNEESQATEVVKFDRAAFTAMLRADGVFNPERRFRSDCLVQLIMNAELAHERILAIDQMAQLFFWSNSNSEPSRLLVVHYIDGQLAKWPDQRGESLASAAVCAQAPFMSDGTARLTALLDDSKVAIMNLRDRVAEPK